MPVTKPKGSTPASRYPPVAAQSAPSAASKKKKKKKGKGKVGDAPVQPNHPYRQDQDPVDEDEDEIPLENDKHRRALESEFEGLRMSTTATAQAELLAAANELYKRMESEQLANDANDGEYWKQLPSHIRSFVETTYAHGAALTPTERTKSQAMLALAQTMVDEATSRFPAGGFPPPFDPSLLSDPKFTEKFGMKSGSLNTMNLMRDYDESYDDYVSDNDEEEMEDEQQYEVDDPSKKKKKKKKKSSANGAVNGTNPQSHPLPPIIPSAPNPAPAITRAAPSVAQPRPSSRAAGKQPVYTQAAVPPSRTTRSTANKSPVPPNPYNHGYSKSSAVNGSSTTSKRPTGGGTAEKDKSKLWSTSTEEERERIKEFWLGLSEAERRDLVKLEKEAVLKKMKEQQKHSCSCAVCGRKRNAIEEELEVLYDAYYEELEQYAIHQQQYQSSGGKITPPPGPGPFPGSVALDKNGGLIGAPISKHPTRGIRQPVNGMRGRKVPPDSADEYDDDDYEDDEDDYDDEEEEEEEEDDDDDPGDRKLGQRRRVSGRGPISRRANGREDFLNFGSLTAAGPGNILTVADDLLKNDGGKFLEMMEQLAERRMQRDEEAAKEVEMASDEEEDDPEESEEDEEDDGEEDDESEEEELMSEEQKMEEGRKMFSIFAARMFEQRVLNAYREKVAAERQEQLLRELADEDKIQAERDAKRQKENQKKKDKKKQQKQAKEAEKARREAEKAAEEAAQRAKQEAMEEEAKKKREEERLKREAERKQKEEEKARQAEERRQRIAEQKAAEAERKREREERERKERIARQEREAAAKAERAERERKAKEERLAREAKEREEREKREKEEREKKEKERAEQLKAAEEKKRQDALATSAKARSGGISPSSSTTNQSSGTSSAQPRKPAVPTVKTNSPMPPTQRAVSNPTNRPPMQQPPQQQPQVSAPNPQQRPTVAGSSQQPPAPIGLQLPPNMGLQPIGIPPYNPIGSPVTISPRVSYGPPGSSASVAAPFTPLTSLAHVQGPNQPPPGLGGMLNGSLAGNMGYPYDTQPPIMSPPQPSATIQPPRPQSALPTPIGLPSKAPGTPITNGIPPIGIPTGPGPNAAAHIRRTSAQTNPSPYGAIGKPAASLARAGSSVVGEEDRMSTAGPPSASRHSPPSPDRPLGSAALVDENDTIVELPKRRGTSSGAGWGDSLGPPPPVGARWGRGPQTAWAPGAIGSTAPGAPLPLSVPGPGSIGAPWPTAPGRSQTGRLGSPFLPS